jgi:hypothetical protein
LVTVEYEDDSSDPQKIILQTQKKPIWEKHSATVSWDLLDKIFSEVHWEDADNNEIDVDEIEKNEDVVIEDSNNQVNNVDKSVKETISTKLTKEEQEEAEEILNLLF